MVIWLAFDRGAARILLLRADCRPQRNSQEIYRRRSSSQTTDLLNLNQLALQCENSSEHLVVRAGVGFVEQVVHHPALLIGTIWLQVHLQQVRINELILGPLRS